MRVCAGVSTYTCLCTILDGAAAEGAISDKTRRTRGPEAVAVTSGRREHHGYGVSSFLAESKGRRAELKRAHSRVPWNCTASGEI